MSDPKIRYVKSILVGSIRCTDGTLVVFVDDEDDPPAAVPAKPRPGPPPPARARR